MTEQNKMVVQMTRGELRAMIQEAVAAEFQKTPKAAEETWLTAKQAASALRKSVKTIYNWIKEGKLKRYTGGDGKRYLISSLEVEEKTRFEEFNFSANSSPDVS